MLRISKDALLTTLFTQTDGVLPEIESENSHLIVNCINRLHKKNLQTKLKAISELTQHLREYEKDAVGDLFSSFLSVYHKLIFHPSYHLRENLNVCLRLFIEKAKTKIKAHLRTFLPLLLISLFDYNKSVNTIASEILCTLFPRKENCKVAKDEREKQAKKKVVRLKLREGQKLYENVKRLNVNLVHLYNCIKYVKCELTEVVTCNLRNAKNDEDFDSSVYLFNVLCFFPSLVYIIVKFASVETPTVDASTDAVENTAKDAVREIVKGEFPHFGNIYKLFFKALSVVYKTNKDNVRVRKLLYLSTYNIIYLFKKHKIDYIDFNNEEANECIYDYICCVVTNKDEYILKSINHYLLLYFFSENKRMINSTLLRGYLSLVKQNRMFGNDAFNFTLTLFIFIFEKEDIKKNFFFFFLLLYFLLLNRRPSAVDTYYDVLLYLNGFFPPDGKTSATEEDVLDVINENGILSDTQCSAVFLDNVFLLPLECILIQMNWENLHFSFPNPHLYENLLNVYYCCSKKKQYKKEGKEINKLEELKERIMLHVPADNNALGGGNLHEGKVLAALTNFIAVSHFKDELIERVLRLLRVYVGHVKGKAATKAEEAAAAAAAEEAGKSSAECRERSVRSDETSFRNKDKPPHKKSDNRTPSCENNNLSNPINFILKFLLELRQIIYQVKEGNEQICISTKYFFVNLLKEIFALMLIHIRCRVYRLIGIVANNLELLLFLLTQDEQNNDEIFSLGTIFNTFEKLLEGGELEKSTHFDAIKICLHLIPVFFEISQGDSQHATRSLLQVLFRSFQRRQDVKEQLAVCVELILFMINKKRKYFDMRYIALEAYSRCALLGDTHRSDNGCLVSDSEAVLISFYEAVFSGGMSDLDIFERSFYHDMLCVYKEKIHSMQSHPDNNFCEFFLKMCTYNVFSMDSILFGCDPFGDLLLYFMIAVYFKVSYNNVENYVEPLFAKLKKETLFSCIHFMKSVYEYCVHWEGSVDGRRGHNTPFAKEEISSTSDRSIDSSSDSSGNGDGESDRLYLSATVEGGIVGKATISTAPSCESGESEKREEDMDDGGGLTRGEDNHGSNVKMCYILHRKDVLSEKYILRLLLIYRIYHGVQVFTRYQLKRFALFCFGEEGEAGGKGETGGKGEAGDKGETGDTWDPFFDFIYRNARCQELYSLLRTLKKQTEKEGIYIDSRLILFFRIHAIFMKKEKEEKDYPLEEVNILDVIRLMKKIKEQEIIDICKKIVKEKNGKGEFSCLEDTTTLQSVANELNSYKVKSIFDLKVKIFLFKQYVVRCIICSQGKVEGELELELEQELELELELELGNSADDVQRNAEVDRENPRMLKMRDEEFYEKRVKRLKERLPLFFHTYVEENMSLCAENELCSLNLIHHLVCISRLIPDFNFFNCKAAQRVLASMPHVSMENYDIYFRGLRFVPVCAYGLGTPFFGRENAFTEYISFLKAHYKRHYKNQAAVQKERGKSLGNMLMSSFESGCEKDRCGKHEREEESTIPQLREKIGIHFLKYIIYILTENDTIWSDVRNSKSFMYTVIKILYFILSIHQCCQKCIDGKLKEVCVELLRNLFEKNSKFFNPIHKIFFFSLPLSITHYSEYLVKEKVFFENFTLDDESLKNVKRKILDVYMNTFYLYILFSNMEKYKESSVFIDRSFSILLINCIMFLELSRLKSIDTSSFLAVSAYLSITEQAKNSFLNSITVGRNSDTGNGAGDVEGRGAIREKFPIENEQGEFRSAFVDSLDGKVNSEMDGGFFSEGSDCLDENTSRIGRLQDDGEKHPSLRNSRRKENPLYSVKRQLKNIFLMIDLNENILDLYTFLQEMNYLKVLLSMINICLSSEYFIYDQHLYQQFMTILESQNFNMYNFLSDIKDILHILDEHNDDKHKCSMNSKKKKTFLFFLSLYLALHLITIFPNECITVINEDKLLNIVQFNEMYFSNLIIKFQLNELRCIAKEYPSTSFFYDPITKTLSFKYKIREDDNQQLEDVTAKLTLNFLPNYPFSHLAISDKIESLDRKADIHNSIKSMYKYARTGNINDMFIRFDSLMNGYFQNKAQCNICFMLLHDQKICDKICSRCGTSYHSFCLRKWFLTSHNTKCPSCQMQFT
ncbi:conserved Plasmodium protein, unknown function [Plasmodium ovale wallikeri]|uniref:E3 ubiquitin-protein ligase listerin n=1 Tax=Plasmodium ovale wallikeri TaxID=864142 RepID=A0A1A8Z3X9_PLAOA|nr:conserved Plasmodium protein, unknown function [Plasmodium ovale wallikeri]